MNGSVSGTNTAVTLRPWSMVKVNGLALVCAPETLPFHGQTVSGPGVAVRTTLLPTLYQPVGTLTMPLPLVETVSW